MKRKRRWGIWISIALSGFLVSCVLVFFFTREEARRTNCGSLLRSIGLSLQQYAMDFDGYFPPLSGVAGLNLLIETEYLTDRGCYICPSHKLPRAAGKLTEDHCGYIYNGGLRIDSPPDTILMVDKPGNHPGGYRNYLTVSGKWR